MAFSTESIGKWYAEGRNYGSMILGFATGIGLMTAAQQQGMMDALNQMYQGFLMIVSGATSFYQILIVAFPIVGVMLAKWAKKSATVDNQAAAVLAAAKDPNTDVSKGATANLLAAAAETAPLAKPIEVKDKELAELAPTDKVVAK
jgi:hypothetical protein